MLRHKRKKRVEEEKGKKEKRFLGHLRNVNVAAAEQKAKYYRLNNLKLSTKLKCVTYIDIHNQSRIQ